MSEKEVTHQHFLKVYDRDKTDGPLILSLPLSLSFSFLWSAGLTESANFHPSLQSFIKTTDKPSPRSHPEEAPYWLRSDKYGEEGAWPWEERWRGVIGAIERQLQKGWAALKAGLKFGSVFGTYTNRRMETVNGELWGVGGRMSDCSNGFGMLICSKGWPRAWLFVGIKNLQGLVIIVWDRIQMADHSVRAVMWMYVWKYVRSGIAPEVNSYGKSEWG